MELEQRFSAGRSGMALIVAAVAMTFAATPLPVLAGGFVQPPVPDPILTHDQLLAKAAPDECFNGVGVDYPPMNPDGTCPEGVPKINQSRIWAMTEQSGKIWFGTLANSQCVVSGQVTGTPPPVDNSLFVCEYGASEGARAHPSVPPTLGDWRAPQIYSYDLATGTLARQDVQDPRLNQTLGFRGAGSIDGIAFLAGQRAFGPAPGINIFAFNADTGEYLGSCSRTDYNYVRGWKQVDGVLYVGVGAKSHGAVLRWNGSLDSFRGNFCKDFAEVATLPSAVANVARYTGADGQDRLAVTTVALKNPTNGARSAAGIGTWISPPVGPAGLTGSAAQDWQQVWSPLQYDPDKITARYGYAGGAVVEFDGWLYWGTIHLGGAASIQVHEKCSKDYCFGMPENDAQLAALKAGVYRTASLWRGRNLEDPRTREVQLLYGESELPACCSAPKTFALAATGWTPLYGPSGFGNPDNEYIWRMATFDGHLFIGTYDTSWLKGREWLRMAGADLWRIDSSDSPAVNESYNGLGNWLNAGIRALEPLEDGSGLILGTSNGANLSPEGGWELHLLTEGGPAQ